MDSKRWWNVIFMLVGVLFGVLFSDKSNAGEDILIPSYHNAEFAKLDSLQCATLNLYHESRSESDIANVMVMAVVLNRVDDKRYPNNICNVVFQPKAFSWTSDGLSDKVYNPKQYKRLYKIVEWAMINQESVKMLSEGIDHYHTTDIHPYWADSLTYKITLDKHKFYKWEK